VDEERARIRNAPAPAHNDGSWGTERSLLLHFEAGTTMLEYDLGSREMKVISLPHKEWYSISILESILSH